MTRVQTTRSNVRRLLADYRASRSEAEPEYPDWSGDCEAPALIQLDGRPDVIAVSLGIERDRAILMEAKVRCRSCGPCLRYRSRVWSARAADEIGQSIRTWFGTLTVAPVHRLQMSAKARKRARLAGVGIWEDLPASKQFSLLQSELGPDLTRFIKRVRSSAAVPLRYLAVFEAHKDGFPHVHMLFHELGGPCPKRILDNQWRVGFSQWRLCEVGDVTAGFYVAKYLMKSQAARIRASAKYGRARDGARVRAMLERAFRGSEREWGLE